MIICYTIPERLQIPKIEEITRNKLKLFIIIIEN